MKPQQLRAFVAVAQTLSFVRAGEMVHLSQSALSLAIRGLEESLGGRLLSRSTRQVRLTPEGAAFLPIAHQLLADWDNAKEQLKQRFTLQRGHITIAAMPSFAGNLLPQILLIFRDRYPNIQVSVQDVLHEQVLEMVESGRVEMGIGFQPETEGHLLFTPLFVDRFVAIAPARHPLAQKAKVSWSELLEQPFITLQRPSTVRQLLERSLATKGIELLVSLECHQLATVGQFVASGLGVSAVPALCLPHMTALGAHAVPLIAPIVKRPVGLITRRDRDISSAAHAMLEVARANSTLK